MEDFPLLGIPNVHGLIPDSKPYLVALPEKLAWMVASEFILDAAIRSKLGRRATE
jgi:hypothetical protein